MDRMKKVGAIYLADSAVVVGDVTIGDDSSVWHHAVIRGDVAPIRIGSRVNIQDSAVCHCNHDTPLDIADDVIIGHHAIVHCRRVGSRTLVGSRATLLDDSEIGEDCLIAAGAVVPPGMIVSDGSVVMGMPGRVTRGLRDSERQYIQRVLVEYVELARRHVAGEFPPFDEPLKSA